jgi:16S rRNA (cytosine1402-N4)-methyltransferase
VAGGRYFDCTFGGGGHTRAMLEAADGVEVVALDRDPEATPRRGPRGRSSPGASLLVDQDFGRLADIADMASTGFDGVLFDFGLSSFQLDDPERGFSFRSDAPADMRMDPRAGVPASQWLETATEEMLVRAIRDFGEEPHWRRIVRAIVAARGTGALGRTATLADLISEAIPDPDRHDLPGPPGHALLPGHPHRRQRRARAPSTGRCPRPSRSFLPRPASSAPSASIPSRTGP